MEKTDPRVLIAQDVIKALDVKRMCVITGFSDQPYVHFEMPAEPFDEFVKRDAREALKGKQCSVCAKGALLVAAIDRFNKVKLEELYDNAGYGHYRSIAIYGETPSKKWLEQWFDADQLTLIEAAFETSMNCGSDGESLYGKYLGSGKYEIAYGELVDSPINHAVYFGEGYDGHDERLRAIMQNIIDHNGEFVPV